MKTNMRSVILMLVANLMYEILMFIIIILFK
jgi:hypothetical protein